MAGKKKKAVVGAVSNRDRVIRYPEKPERIVSPARSGTNPLDGLVLEEEGNFTTETQRAQREEANVVPKLQHSSTPSSPRLSPAYRDDGHGIWLYQGNCLSILDAISAKYPEGCFDMIFADPPYFLSNGGITCHAGKMVKVDKGEWDRSRGAELNHEFNTEWLKRCQRVLKPNGTIWVTGTHHVIFSVGYAMQQLGMKILNDIAWEKPNPPPNLSCRYFTHSTETVLWAAKNEKSKHVFNYKTMKAVTGKQMKTVWRQKDFQSTDYTDSTEKRIRDNPCSSVDEPTSSSVWTLPAPGMAEKEQGKHPTQKPVALIERCLLAATNVGDFVLDPFMGAGTTGVACMRNYRLFVGIELGLTYVSTAGRRADREISEIWLRDFKVFVEVSVVSSWERFSTATGRNDQNDLDPGSGSMDRISEMADVPDIQTEAIFHETKFVFLSCAQARTGSVVHTTIDADVQSAWTHTPQSVKLQTTHIVRCETEILHVKSS